MILNEFVGNRQSQARPFLFGGKVGPEKIAQMFRTNPLAGIRNFDKHLLFQWIGFNAQAAAGGHGLGGIFDQV